MVRAKVSAEAREMCLGHSIGLNKSYYRPDEKRNPARIPKGS